MDRERFKVAKGVRTSPYSHTDAHASIRLPPIEHRFKAARNVGKIFFSTRSSNGPPCIQSHLAYLLFLSLSLLTHMVVSPKKIKNNIEAETKLQIISSCNSEVNRSTSTWSFSVPKKNSFNFLISKTPSKPPPISCRKVRRFLRKLNVHQEFYRQRTSLQLTITGSFKTSKVYKNIPRLRLQNWKKLQLQSHKALTWLRRQTVHLLISGW